MKAWGMAGGLAAILIALATETTASAQANSARDIIRAIGINVGLCVHLDVTDGRLTADLAKEGSLVVHGLAQTIEATEAARNHIASRGLYGAVSVEQGSCSSLPYVNNLVDIVVVEDAETAFQSGLSLQEVLRVLRPGGIAYLGRAQKARSRLDRNGVNDYEILQCSTSATLRDRDGQC